MPPNHAILMFTKLQTFERATEIVTAKLQDIIDGDDLLRDNFEIKRYEKGVQLYRYHTVTAVVVLDARQTRALITPLRRDPNVDHWNELQELETITKPQGSLFVIIYGDDSSKDGDKKLIADQWLSIWKFNDEKTYSLAAKKRCFTMWDTFNPTQEDVFKKYLQILPIVPVDEGHVNVLVLSDNDVRGKYKGYLDQHPFLIPTDEARSEKVDGLVKEVYEYFTYKDVVSGGIGKSNQSLNVYYKDGVGLRKLFCENRVDETELETFFPDGVKIDNVVIFGENYAHLIGKQGIETNKAYDVTFGLEDDHNQDMEVQRQIIEELKSRQFGTIHEEERKTWLQNITTIPNLAWLYMLYSCRRLKAWKERTTEQCCNQNIVLVSHSDPLRSKFENMVQHATNFKKLDFNPYTALKDTQCRVVSFTTENGSVYLVSLKYTKDEKDLEILRKDVKSGILHGKWFSGNKPIHGIVCLQLVGGECDTFIESLTDDIKRQSPSDNIAPIFHVTMSTKEIDQSLQSDVKDGPISKMYFEKLKPVNKEDSEKDSVRYAYEIFKILSSSKEYYQCL